MNLRDTAGPVDGVSNWHLDPLINLSDDTKADMVASVAWDKDGVQYGK